MIHPRYGNPLYLYSSQYHHQDIESVWFTTTMVWNEKVDPGWLRNWSVLFPNPRAGSTKAVRSAYWHTMVVPSVGRWSHQDMVRYCALVVPRCSLEDCIPTAIVKQVCRLAYCASHLYHVISHLPAKSTTGTATIANSCPSTGPPRDSWSEMRRSWLDDLFCWSEVNQIKLWLLGSTIIL